MAHIDLADNKIKNVRTIIYKIENGEKLFLITQERDGAFTIPGGCKDTEDSDLLATAERELKEELGLTEKGYSIKQLQGEYEYENLYSDPESERFGKNTIIYPFLVLYNGAEPIKIDDVADAVWMNERKAMEVLNTDHMKEMLRIGIQNIK